MKFYNVSFSTVQWLVEKDCLLSIERSTLAKMPNKIDGTAFVSNFYDLRDLCEATGEFYNCDEIKECLNGFNVEVRDDYKMSDTPQELIVQESKF